MLNRGDAVVYKCRGLYKVEDIGTLDFSFADRKKKYYTLQSVEDERDRAYVPTDDESNIRQHTRGPRAEAALPVLTGNIRCFLNMRCTVNFLSFSESRQVR